MQFISLFYYLLITHKKSVFILGGEEGDAGDWGEGYCLFNHFYIIIVVYPLYEYKILVI